MQASQTQTVQINPTLSLAGQLGPWDVGSVVNVQCQATDGTLPYTWAAAGLPPGLSINPQTGLITGTVGGSPGTVSVTITVSDAAP